MSNPLTTLTRAVVDLTRALNNAANAIRDLTAELARDQPTDITVMQPIKLGDPNA